MTYYSRHNNDDVLTLTLKLLLIGVVLGVILWSTYKDIQLRRSCLVGRDVPTGATKCTRNGNITRCVAETRFVCDVFKAEEDR